MSRVRRRTTCRVPGHGTRCEVAREKARLWPRGSQQRMALAFERAAELGGCVSRIEINADGRQVVVDADGTADDLAGIAIRLWEHAESYRPAGPATGFVDTERRWSADAAPMSRGEYGQPAPGRVDARDTAVGASHLRH